MLSWTQVHSIFLCSELCIIITTLYSNLCSLNLTEVEMGIVCTYVMLMLDIKTRGSESRPRNYTAHAHNKTCMATTVS